MLKTIELQQPVVPLEVSSEYLAPLASSEPGLTTDEEVLNPESLEIVQTLVDEFSSESKRRRRRFWNIWGTMIASFLPLSGLLFFLSPRLPSQLLILHPALEILLVLIPFGLCIPMTKLMTKLSRQQQDILDRLVTENNLRSISPLMAGVGTASKSTRGLMVRALISLLPRLQESDTAWLTDADHRGLLTVIRFANSGLMRKYYGDGWDDFVIAALSAISEVGDSRALGPVTALATGDSTAGATRCIREAAITCQEPLKRRLDRERVGQHLLRSSGQPDIQTEMLLIPAAETSDTDVQQLPRPSSPN